MQIYADGNSTNRLMLNGGIEMSVYISEVNGNYEINVEEEIKRLEEKLTKAEIYEEYSETLRALKGFRELTKLPMPTLIVEDITLQDEDEELID